jgi:uncharacterized repeat protein (TIGR01451 family)
MNKSHTRPLVAVFIVAAALMLSASQAKAEQCISQYGGGETCDRDAKLKVNKEIWNPEKKDWVDHISSKDYMFDAKDKITFRITVKNVGDIEIKDIKLTDYFPSYVRYLDGDGDGESDDEKAVFDKFDLKPGKSKSFEFRAKVAGSDILPKDSKICLTNIAKAKGEVKDSDKKEDASDYANFCIDLPNKKKEKITKLPTTGFDFGLVGLSTGLVLVGFGIRKLTE